MTGADLIDAYTGVVHDRVDRMANDAIVALRRLMHSGRTSVSINPGERGAVPMIGNDVHPDRFASVYVDVHDSVHRSWSKGQRSAMVTVVPGTEDVLRTNVAILVEECGSLFPQGASIEEIARAVIEAGAVHVARAYEQARPERAEDDTDLDDAKADTVHTIDAGGSALRVAQEAASLAALNPHADAATTLVMPTPWNPARTWAIEKGPVEMDPELSERIPTMLRVETVFVFTDTQGRGTSPTIKLMPVTTIGNAVDPMERLRAMKHARNQDGDAMRLHAEPDHPTIRARCA